MMRKTIFIGKYLIDVNHVFGQPKNPTFICLSLFYSFSLFQSYKDTKKGRKGGLNACLIL